MQGWGGISEHCVYMAFTSKISAWVVPWLPLPPTGPPLIKKIRAVKLLPRVTARILSALMETLEKILDHGFGLML